MNYLYAMRILFLASWFPSRVHPTHGNFVAKHARVVAKMHKLCVLNIQDDPGLATGKTELCIEQQDGYQLYQLYFGQAANTPGWKRIWLRYKAWKAVTKAYQKTHEKPDCIHAHVLLDAGMFAALLGKKWNLPFVITEHSTAYWSPNALTGLRGWLGRWACRRAAQILPVTPALGRAMQQNGLKGHYGAVSNVVNTELFEFKPPPTQPPFVLLHISNFRDWHKNVSGLMRAFKTVLEQTDKDIILHLAGDGDLDDLRSSKVQARLPDDKVRISGKLSEAEVARTMQESHAFVLFSNVENQPVVLLEALSCGRPCIATSVGGIPDMITDKNGIIVQPKTETELVAAIIQLLDTYIRYDLNNISQDTAQYCGETAVAKAFTKVYEAAVA